MGSQRGEGEIRGKKRGGVVPDDRHLGDILKTPVEDGTPDVDLEPGFKVVGTDMVMLVENDSGGVSDNVKTAGVVTNRDDSNEWIQAWSPCFSQE